MKEHLTFRDKDMIVMKLLHYFITEKGYNPIILRGVENEIWLENMDAPYRIVRIMTGYIHNNTQYETDLFKTKRILHQIKLKTLSFKVKTLSIFTDLSEYVDVKKDDSIDCVVVKDEKDIVESKEILDVFSDIDKKLVKKGADIDLFTRITSDLNIANKKRAKEAEELFKSTNPIITYVLIGLNILMFVLMYIFGSGSEHIGTLLKFGALSKYHIIMNNEYYRIFTSAFLHIGFLHLFLNLYALKVMGTQVENYFGKTKYLIIYFVSILISSLLSLVIVPTEIISAGASGAIFGLFGALLYFGYNYRAYFGNVILKQLLPIIVINLVVGFVSQGVNNAAHVGGLLGGFLISYVTGLKGKSSKNERINGIISLVVLVGILVYLVFFKSI